MDVSENWGYLQIIQNSWGFPLFSPIPFWGVSPLFLGNTHIFIDSFMVQFSQWLPDHPIDPTGTIALQEEASYLPGGDHPILASGW